MLKVNRPGFGSLAESGQKTLKVGIHSQESRQKNFQEGPTEKRPKNSTSKPLPGGGQHKKDRKIALLSLYLLQYICIMYENPGAHGPLPPTADAHV